MEKSRSVNMAQKLIKILNIQNEELAKITDLNVMTISNFKNNIYTDLTQREIVQVANFIRNVPSSKQRVEMLPGKFGELNGVSYWIPLKQETRELVKEFFYQ